jgi:hypothetical protein
VVAMTDDQISRMEKIIEKMADKIEIIPSIVNRLDNLNSFKSKCEYERKDFETRMDSVNIQLAEVKSRMFAYGKAIMIVIALATVVTTTMSFIFNRIEKANLNIGLEKQVEKLANIAIDNRRMIEENKKKLETPSK